MGFPKIRGTCLGIRRISTMVFGRLYWGPPTQGFCHLGFRAKVLFEGCGLEFRVVQRKFFGERANVQITQAANVWARNSNMRVEAGRALNNKPLTQHPKL